MRRLHLVVVAVLWVAGCGGPSSGVEHGGSANPPEITAESFHTAQRTYWRMAPDDPHRRAWRDALIGYLGERSEAVLETGDYDEVVQHTASMAELLHPSDFTDGAIPEPLGPLARWIIEHGSPRGDEGRVMAAHLLLQLMAEGEASHAEERRRIAEWGRTARAPISNPIERYGSLIQVWEQHEQLAPAPEVLEMLARLYVEQRDGLLAAFGPEGQGTAPGRLSFQHLRLAPLLVQRAPLDVAAVYLRHGDLERAIESVRRMGDQSGVEAQLIRLLERAREDNAGGAEALAELSQGFARARPNVSAAICRVGARRFESDPRFPLCLARAAMEEDEPGAAVAWYEEAVRLAPEERRVYDEALGQLDEMIEQGLLASDIAQARSIGNHALTILEERDRRWPQAADASDGGERVRRESLLLHLGQAEMNTGHVDRARQRLEASLEARETADAHRLLGLLLERTGDADQAAVHYRAALDATTDQQARARLQEQLGDAFRHAGQPRQAQRMYRQALSTWEAIVGTGDRRIGGPRRAVAEIRRGILLSRLGERAASVEAFGRAMDAAPTFREAYAEILSHLVVSDPNLELAQTVLRRAQYQLTLETEWKVYFALWVQAIAGRASAETERDVQLLLRELSGGESWSNRLAAFGRSRLEYPQLRDLARDRGQRTEADFYEGARLLGAGDVAGARRLFERVLESHMVSFFEYAMAQELLAQLPEGSGEVAESGATQ